MPPRTCSFCKLKHHTIRTCASPMARDVCLTFAELMADMRVATADGGRIGAAQFGFEVSVLMNRLKMVFSLAQLRLLCCCRNAMGIWVCDEFPGRREASSSIPKAAALRHLATVAARTRFHTPMVFTSTAPTWQATLASLTDSQFERHDTDNPLLDREFERLAVTVNYLRWHIASIAPPAVAPAEARPRRPMLQYVLAVGCAPTLPEDETCPVCFEPLKVDALVKLDCAHCFCGACVQRMCDMQRPHDDRALCCALCRASNHRAQIFNPTLTLRAS